MYVLYTIVLTFGLVAVLPYYLFRSRNYGRTLFNRLGFVETQPEHSAIWIHAVSVGEVKAVDSLVERLTQEFPKLKVLLSTTTMTGQELAKKRDDFVRIIFFPIDIPNAVSRVLERVRPKLVVMTETEIWPNFLRECRRRKIPVIMLNGRISDQSYGRYLILRSWLRSVLSDYWLLAMQSETDADRIRAMGAAPDKIAVFGNIKYDLGPPPPTLEQKLIETLEALSPLLVAASTASGEEKQVLEAFRRLRKNQPKLKLLVAPRLSSRFNVVSQLLKKSEFSSLRRSELMKNAESTDIILLDSIGELTSVFQHATVVFMGGTLVPRGGHNVLEPARFAKPILFGPHMQNFREMANQFVTSKAAVQVSDIDNLVNAIDYLLKHPSDATKLGNNARRLVEKNSGATDNAIKAIRQCLEEIDQDSEKIL